LIEFILGAFIYAKYKKYNLIPFFKSWVAWLPISFCLAYIFFEVSIWNEHYFILKYQQMFKIATLLGYIPLCVFYRLYENDNIEYQHNQLKKTLTSPMIIGSLFLLLGSTLNRIAIFFNNGYMMTFPSNSYWTGYIKPQLIDDGLHKIGNAYTHIIPFCNQFDLGYSILSLGDILIRLFVFIILYNSIKQSNKIIK
jgi:hypothetical protein